MPSEKNMPSLLQELRQFKGEALTYFTSAEAIVKEGTGFPNWGKSEPDTHWNLLTPEQQAKSRELTDHFLTIAEKLAAMVTSSPFAGQEDRRTLSHAIKKIRAALRLRGYSQWDPEILHDEGIVLGVRPAGQSEDSPSLPKEAQKDFLESYDELIKLVEVTGLSEPFQVVGSLAPREQMSSRYKPNTAFIMMWMDPTNAELEDLSEAVKRTFSKFGIKAMRADDIEHQDVITKRILEEIATAEFLYADLTGERPSVYYEVGYAHALGRRVILFRKHGSQIHFDLAAYNCPEYKNCSDLEKKLTNRLQEMTNKKLI